VKPHVIDLFGGQGLAAYGYALSGWRVTSVENDPERIAEHVEHPDITVVEADATTYPLDHADAVHGSPLCTAHSSQATIADKVRGRDPGTGWMLPHTIARLRAWGASTGRPWVVENVEGAKPVMGSPLVLCGTMFGLTDGGWHLKRHRLFESNVPLMAPGPHRCRARGVRIIHVNGDLAANDRPCGGKRRPGGDMRAGVERARRLMGAPWASARGLALGLPVEYTRYIGEQLLDHLGRGRELVTSDTGTYPQDGAS
jgi:DNA (cytosine-5)-methyltransferase 1